MIKNIIIVVLVVVIVYLYMQTAKGQQEIADLKGKIPSLPNISNPVLAVAK